MTFGPESLRIQRDRMLTVRRIEDAAARQLIRGWARAWSQASNDLQGALLDASSRAAAGERLSWRQVNRIERFQAAIARLAANLDDLAATGRVEIVNAAEEAVRVSREMHPRLIASQLPNVGASTVELAAQLSGRVQGEAYDAIIQRAQENIVSRMQPLPADTMAQVRRSLIQGITVGDNPRETARRMLARVEGGFGGGLTRALRISRTESLDAFRSANATIDRANPDIVTGWRWTSAIDERTCEVCVSMHGRDFPTEEPGPEGHVNCRCDRVPITRSWRDLGFDVDEPPDIFPSRDDYWSRLPREAKLDKVGPSKLAALEDGRIGLDDLAVKRPNDGWRDSWKPRTLDELGVEQVAA